jgi:uncharacterized membrane protein (UPF0127 family)
LSKIVFLAKVKFSLGIIGLMFSRKKPIPHVFKKRFGFPINSMHGWFMNYPLDIIFLDDKNIVIDKACFGPFGGYTSRVKGVVYAVEAMAGDFDDIELGDTVLWNG